ncbi:MAG TPA: hypothetical protein VNL14_11245 [Candidatus Acidoferrales bacterium]|nr:hypothetical protein [Candidatus Acidoferrales bacterium]
MEAPEAALARAGFERMAPSSLRVIVTGFIGHQRLLGGVAWDYLNVVLGLKRLGHDVYYIEDSGCWPYNHDGGPSGRDWTDWNPRPTVEHLSRVMSAFDLQDRWAYRFPPKSEWFGMSDARRKEIVRSADALINVAGTLEKPWDYRSVGKLIYIDTDPVFCQIGAVAGADSAIMSKRLDAHDVFFTVGECLNANDEIPKAGRKWNTTKHPVLLDQWRNDSPPGSAFTTVMNWSSYDPIAYQSRRYGQKDVEFVKFIDLPRKLFPTRLEIALYKPRLKTPRSFSVSAPVDDLERAGWKVVDAAEVCPDFESYRRYIRQSKGEWSVAKNGYVAGRSGWFSGRSACYLAAGRPVVVQDTGFSALLPVGEGVVAFTTLEEAQAGIRCVEADYARHANAAREIARAYFDSDKVLRRLVEIAMNARA